MFGFLLDLTSLSAQRVSKELCPTWKSVRVKPAILCPGDIYKAHTITWFQTCEHFISYYSLVETEPTSLPRSRELSSTNSLQWAKDVGAGRCQSGRARTKLGWKSLHFPRALSQASSPPHNLLPPVLLAPSFAMIHFLLLIDTALQEQASPSACCVFNHGSAGGLESINGKNSRARFPTSQPLLRAALHSVPPGQLWASRLRNILQKAPL